MGAIVWVFLGLLAFAVLGLAWVLFQIVRQQGRLLLRLESLERLGPGAELAGSVEANGSPRQERGLSLHRFGSPTWMGGWSLSRTSAVNGCYSSTGTPAAVSATRSPRSWRGSRVISASTRPS